jgi:hypothetical protein
MTIFMFRAAVVLLFALTTGFGQSTSPWIYIEGSAGTGGADGPSLGSTYLTATFINGQVYQKSNWWTSFVETKRSGVLEIKLAGNVNGKVYEHVRTSQPIELRKNDSMVDFGMFNQIVVDKLPTVYNPLSISVSISKSSSDGLDALLTSLSEISKNTPALTVSQSAMGIVSGSKVLADYLFSKNLLVKKMESSIDFPTTGNTLKPGLWVCFAGDTKADYQKYQTVPDGGTGLKWKLNELSWNGQEIKKVSYFVVQISYDTQVFTKPSDSLTILTKPWVSLYLAGSADVKQITSVKDIDKISGQIRGHLTSADALLNADPDYIYDEKKRVMDAIWKEVEKELNERIAGLPVPAGGAKPKPIHLLG